MKIAVIHNQPIPRGEPNWESSADVMVQVEAVSAALAELGQQFVPVPFTRDLAAFTSRLKEEEVTGVFNLCESVDDDPLLIGHPAAILELLGLPFTGSSSLALAVSTDKALVKRVMTATGIRTPPFFLYEGGELIRPPDLAFPLLMKPRWQDASIGIDQESVIRGPKELLPTLAAWHARFGPLVVEEYIEGREFNLSLFGYPVPRIMPLAEIDFTGFPAGLHRIVGYRAKWDESSVEYHTTRRTFPDDLPETMARAMRRVARECFQVFGLRDYARVDLRLDGRGRVNVLEINANPCLSPDAGFSAAVAKNRLDYTGMVGEMVKMLAMRAPQ
jgi:D-alanine-D-alanine ligase